MRNIVCEVYMDYVKSKKLHPESQCNVNAHVVLQTLDKMLKDNKPTLIWLEKMISTILEQNLHLNVNASDVTPNVALKFFAHF